MKIGDKGTLYVLVKPDGKEGYVELNDHDVPDSPVFQDEDIDQLKAVANDAVRQHGAPVGLGHRTVPYDAQGSRARG